MFMSDGGWTLESFMEHTAALREADERFHAERDRRYADVAVERTLALALARESQHEKDQKANALREQISAERGRYLTVEVYAERHEELIRRITAVEQLIAADAGRNRGFGQGGQLLYYVIVVAVAVLTLVLTR